MFEGVFPGREFFDLFLDTVSEPFVDVHPRCEFPELLEGVYPRVLDIDTFGVICKHMIFLI